MYSVQSIYFYLPHPITHRYISAIGQYFHTFSRLQLRKERKPVLHSFPKYNFVELGSSVYPPSASSSTTSKMATKRSIRRLGFLSLLLLSFALVLSSCGGKSDLPGGEFGSADLKQEISISASAPISVHFNANTQGGSDIYRDGKLVGQITYSSEWREPIAKSYRTTFTHKGSGLYVGIIVRRPDNAPGSIKVKTSVKLYRGNKYLKTYEKEVTLTSDPSLSLSSELYKVEANGN